MVELYEECTDLSFQPFNYTDNNEYFLGDNADPDINFYNRSIVVIILMINLIGNFLVGKTDQNISL